MPLFHVTIARAGRHPLFQGEHRQRLAVWILCRCIGHALLLFCIVDDHLHLVLEGTRADAGHLAGTLQQALRRSALLADPGEALPRQAAMTEPARVHPVESRRHLEHLVRYVLRQPARHELPAPLATWSGSCFLDLIEARLVRGFDRGRIRRALPRLTEREIWRAVDLPVLQPLDERALDGFGARQLVAAACAVHGVGPELDGRTTPVLAARTLAIHLGLEAGLSPATLGEVLGCAERSLRRHRAEEVDPRAWQAARRYLAIEQHLGDRPGPR